MFRFLSISGLLAILTFVAGSAVAQNYRVQPGDTLRIAGERMESPGHARARVKSAMHYANRTGFTGTIDMVGNTRLIAGNTVELIGFGQYSGKRLINSASHSMARGGYTTSGELVDAR